MGDRVMMAKYFGQVDMELAGLARDLVELEELEEQERREDRRQRRWWTRDWLLRRPLHGQYEALMAELELEDPQTFQQFLRLDVATFHDILARIEGRITKQTTYFRRPISPGLKLAFTLRYLATGNYYRDLRFGFRVAHNTMSGLIVDVCQALVDVLEPEFVKLPTEAEEWQQVALAFQQKWQFPHTLGALDGKHIRIKKPPHSGSTYHNYKGFDSIVLMALVDAQYRFLWTQIGDVGSSSDGQIWNHCDFRQALQDGVLGVPDADPLPGDDVNTPYYIIGDDAFAMRTWLMKPFPRRGLDHGQQVFNYRLSRARRVVENAFGILANRFRCLLSTLQVHVDTAALVVRSCVTLHNYLRVRNPAADQHLVDQEDAQHNLVDGAWRANANLLDLTQPQCGNRDTREAKRQRLYLKNYLTSPAGSVPWQDQRLRQF